MSANNTQRGLLRSLTTQPLLPATTPVVSAFHVLRGPQTHFTLMGTFFSCLRLHGPLYCLSEGKRCIATATHTSELFTRFSVIPTRTPPTRQGMIYPVRFPF